MFSYRLRESSPAGGLVRFVLWEESKVGTQSVPQQVQPSSPDLTAGSRNSELGQQVYFPKTKTQDMCEHIFNKTQQCLHLHQAPCQ